MRIFPHCISKDPRENNFLLALDSFPPTRIKSRTASSQNMFYRTEVLTEFSLVCMTDLSPSSELSFLPYQLLVQANIRKKGSQL